MQLFFRKSLYFFFLFFSRERNKIYTDICKNRPGNDRFVEKTMQTINGAAKNKEVQCDKIIMEDKGELSEYPIGKYLIRTDPHLLHCTLGCWVY